MLDLDVVVMDSDALDDQLQECLAVGDAGAVQPCATVLQGSGMWTR